MYASMLENDGYDGGAGGDDLSSLLFIAAAETQASGVDPETAGASSLPLCFIVEVSVSLDGTTGLDIRSLDGL